MSEFWKGKNVLVTGGASFIGSHVADRLLAHGASIRIVDDLSSGKLENVPTSREEAQVEFWEADLRDQDVAMDAMEDMDMVIHIAANHGGRGYVATHQAGPASNLMLDGLVFYAAVQKRIKVVYASSGCVYPNYLQTDPTTFAFLREEQVGPPYEADNTYGWAKLMGEMTLQSYTQEMGLPSVSLRYFTVYGPRGKEDHAIMAMIARAHARQDPFEVWGNGTQLRNWTYVDDIVRGTLLAAEWVDDGRAINLGTQERTSVDEAARYICKQFPGYKPAFLYDLSKPTGPMNRVASHTLATTLMGWSPEIVLREGIIKTVEWYTATHTPEQARAALDRLMER